MVHNSHYKPLPDLGPFYLKNILCDGSEDSLEKCAIRDGSAYGYWCSWRHGASLTDYDYLVAKLKCIRKKLEDMAKLYAFFNYSFLLF